MIKSKKLWKRMPRACRLVILALVFAVLALTLYTFAGSPTLTIEPQFRRAEKAHLVGPSKILGDAELEADLHGGHWTMLIADDGDGIIYYCYAYSDPAKINETELIYREKTGDITVLSAPFPQDDRTNSITARLPVFVFDNYPEAVWAELDITLRADYKGERFEKTYTMTSSRENPGYFQFTLTAANLNGLGSEGYAIQLFTLISNYGGRTLPDLTIPATVCLYDAQDHMICEESLEITSVVEQAHSAREE